MRKLRITIGNKSYEVTVEDLTEASPYQAPPGLAPPAPAQTAPAAAQPQPSKPSAEPNLPVESGAVTSPMAGVILSVLIKQGDAVKQGQPLVVLEAMKMENQITAPAAGTVKSVNVKQGDSVQEGHILLVLE